MRDKLGKKALWLPLLLGAMAAGGCSGVGLSNGGFDIDCKNGPCNWTVVEGSASFEAGWHDGDPAADLSGSGRVVIEQRQEFEHQDTDLVLRAAVVRDDSATVVFELDWYAPSNPTFSGFAQPSLWDHGPIKVGSQQLLVRQSGANAFVDQVAEPPSSARGLIFRIIKEGEGQAIVDELTLDSDLPVLQ